MPCDAYEKDFGRLLALLSVNEDGLKLMNELAIRAERGRQPDDEAEFAQQKQDAIDLAKRRIDAAVYL